MTIHTNAFPIVSFATHCSSMRLSDCDDWAQRHHGLITLHASGLDAGSWRRALDAGTLIEVHRHVARLPGSSATPMQAIHAAVLAGGPVAAASHRSAAMLWGLLDFDLRAGIHVTVSNRSRNPRLAGVYVHRPTDQRRLEPDRRHGISCTSVVRTLCDLGADEPALVQPALDAAVAARLVKSRELLDAVAQHGQRGRGGIPALRSALTARAEAEVERSPHVATPFDRRERPDRQTLKRNSITSPSWAM